MKLSGNVTILKALERADDQKARYKLSRNPVYADLMVDGEKIAHIVSDGYGQKSWRFYPVAENRQNRNSMNIDSAVPKWAAGAELGTVITSSEISEELVQKRKAEEAAAEQAAIDRLAEALESEAFPCNPIPFASGLAKLVRMKGTDAIKTDEAKRILWVLMAQSYGQLATIDLHDEWGRLTKEG